MDPGPRIPIRRLKGADLAIALQGERDLVEPLQKAFAAPRIDLEFDLLAGGRKNRLRRKVDADAPGALRRLDIGGKLVHDLLVDDDGQDTVLKTIGEKDIAKARADDGADTVLLERPHRALARGAAAEIRTGHENFGATQGFAVQDEIRILRTIGQIAQRAERPFAECAANRIADQALDADDDVGVDIAAHDRRSDGRELVEGLWHLSVPWS